MQGLHLLLLRIGFGGMMLYMHGLPKLNKYSVLKDRFPDPIFLGSELSLILIIFAELFCSLLIVLGVAVRLACIPLFIGMLVIIFVVHADDPFSKVEMPILFLTAFIAIFIGGSGIGGIKFKTITRRKPSLDWWLNG